MHEYSIAYDVYLTARRSADDYCATAVTTVYVEVGSLSMVNPEQVSFLFEVIAKEDNHPALAEAKAVCEIALPETSCVCGYTGDEIYVCPVCGALPTVVKGKDVMVTRLEIEVDDDNGNGCGDEGKD
jgi:hydrogenase nickel incorporation protein HypA/HybF